MKLDLRDIIQVPGGRIPFEFQMDLTQMEFYGQRPMAEPIAVSGVVRNIAGALVLEGTASSRLHLTCDRCGKPFLREKTVPLDTLLATRLENGESDDIVLLDPDGQLELDELLGDVFILDLDTKNLCSEDCKGLCPGCGADLNVEPCRCKKEIDPRLAKLAQLLEQDD